MLVCVFVCASCTRDRGCSAHPAFPPPSTFSEGETLRKPRAFHAARMRTHTPCRLTIESEKGAASVFSLARSGYPLVSKILAQYLGQPVGIGLRRHEPQILAVAADQVDDAGMVDRVIPAPFCLHLTLNS